MATGSVPDRRIVVVGASLAGLNTAQSLRRAGYTGRVVVIGDETERPYDRPPLSKEFLTDDLDLNRLTLPPARKSEELDIEIRTGLRATALDLERAEIRLAGTGDSSASTETVGYDGLVIATGARARTLPPSLVSSGDQRASGLYTLRTLDDARRLKQALQETSRPVVVCGAGFIGGEVAASARTLGL